MSDAAVREATTDAEIEACFPVLHDLRPHVAREGFVERIRRQQAAGYRIAFVAEGERVVAAAGWRLSENLADGRNLYVDDLVTDPTCRSHGHGALLVEWLVERARESGCAVLQLDSGVQRFAAHRFYLRHGFEISSHHFRLHL